jgi:hypothetical protein
VCDAVLGRSVCSPCTLNATSLALSRKTVTRGGVLGSPGLCDAYFKCDTGFYLSQSASSLQCLPCVFPEPSQAGWVFVSHGFTFGDAFSCVYRPDLPLINANTWGQYGAMVQSCPVGFTSMKGMSASLADCRRCPSPPLNGGFRSDVPECIPVCNDGYQQRGDACVPYNRRSVRCDGDGYDLDGSGACRAAPLPWNPPGTFPGGELRVDLAARSIPVAAADQLGVFWVPLGQNKLSSAGSADLCAGLIATVSNAAFVQDLPLSALVCSDTEKHDFYLLLTGPKYLYAFLERSFGNNNRFVLWQVQRQKQGVGNNAGQVWQKWRLPGKVCSAVIAPGDVIYMVFCDATFVSYLAPGDFMGAAGVTYDVYSKGVGYWLGRQVGVLVGRDEPGQRDGMRDQALFKGPLSLVLSSDPSRLIVSDRDNCRLVEVVIDTPGSFLTRATTIGQGYCFSGEFPLPYPASVFVVLNGTVVVAVTDRGLVQLDLATRTFLEVMPAEDLRAVMPVPVWVTAERDGEALVLSNGTHSATVTRVSQPCGGRSVSKRGGVCGACPTGTFVSDNKCATCSTPACPANYTLLPCSDASDTACVPCQGSAPYPFRFSPTCAVIPTFPCPPGFYGLSDCYPCASKVLEALPSHGVCQCNGIPLAADGATCVAPSPFASAAGPFEGYPRWLDAFRCTYQDANCTEKGCFLASAHPKSCQVCPPGLVSLNGLWCEACPGFRESGRSQDFCVCKSPSVLSEDGTGCLCPSGYQAGGAQGCEVCAAGKHRPDATPLPEISGPLPEMPGSGCAWCYPGYESSGDRAGCVPCGAGLYREQGMPSCAKCPVPFSFARYPGHQVSCVACQAACGASQLWSDCPVNASMFWCTDCPPLSRFKRYIRTGDNRGCLWECLPNFYLYNSQCWPCTAKSCAPGFVATPCSKFEDSHCRVPCANATKPEENSEWAEGCNWRCSEGYKWVKKTYAGWSEYACEPEQASFWSLGW